MNDNIMSMEEIEKMLKDAGQIDETSESSGSEEAQAAESKPETEVAEATVADTPAASEEAPAIDPNASEFNKYDYISKEEEDVLGEIGNICMGTSATTMCTLLGRRVDITTPRVSVHNPKTLSKGYKAPMVVVDVNYVEGITGKNLLILDEYDVALMTDVLMGGDGSGIDKDNIELDEMHMSAIREVMNQMVGSSATSLANITNKTVDISTPQAHHISLDENEIRELFAPKEMLVKVSFDMEIEGLLKSKIMQILPLDFAKSLVTTLMDNGSKASNTSQSSAPMDNVIKNEAPSVEKIQAESKANEQAAQPAQATASAARQPMGAPARGMTMSATNNVVRSGVNAQEVEYPSFDSVVGAGYAPVPENIALLSNVPMRITVQLGKAKKKVKEILEFNNGSVVVLDKLAGEPVDVLVNGKPIAKGEVVVVDDNYGVRITEINSAALGETL